MDPAFRSITQVRTSVVRANPARMTWTMFVFPEPVGPTTSAHCSRRNTQISSALVR